MTTKTLSNEQLAELRKEVHRRVRYAPQINLPEILGLAQTGIDTGLDIRGETKKLREEIRARDIQRTVKRVWGPTTEVIGMEENIIQDKPHIALVQTSVGDKILKEEKPPEGRSGILMEGVASVFAREVNLDIVSIGIGGIKLRRAA